MTTHDSHAGGYAGSRSPAGLIRRLIADRLARGAERRSALQLTRLDDRLLRDVGLTRADVAGMIDRLD